MTAETDTTTIHIYIDTDDGVYEAKTGELFENFQA